MHKAQRKNTEALRHKFQMSESPIFGKKTITGLLRSILEPVLDVKPGTNKAINPEALVFTRVKNTEGIEGILKRLEFAPQIEVRDFLSQAREDKFVELEFVLLTSARFSTLLVWDYSTSENKDSSRIYFLMNSNKINDVFDELQESLDEDLSERFYSFKPERRDNDILNKAVFNIMELLNENVLENDFRKVENSHYVSENEFEEYRETVSKGTREICHEINNQISVLNIYSMLLERELGSGNKHLDTVKKSVGIIASQLEELRGVEDFQDVDLERKSLKETILRAVDMVSPIAGEKNNKIIFKGDELSAYIDENKYISALINLLKNASESTKDDTIEVLLAADGGFAKVFITNHGEKIVEPDKIFNSGFSTKGTSGVGLSVSKKYLEAQFSILELSHSTDVSTQFTITTPQAT